MRGLGSGQHAGRSESADQVPGSERSLYIHAYSAFIQTDRPTLHADPNSDSPVAVRFTSAGKSFKGYFTQNENLI